MGSYTNDYVANALPDRGTTILRELSATDVSTAAVSMPNGSIVTLDKINQKQKSIGLGSCRSLEHSPDGKKVQFLGGEWHNPFG